MTPNQLSRNRRKLIAPELLPNFSFSKQIVIADCRDPALKVVHKKGDTSTLKTKSITVSFSRKRRPEISKYNIIELCGRKFDSWAYGTDETLKGLYIPFKKDLEPWDWRFEANTQINHKVVWITKQLTAVNTYWQTAIDYSSILLLKHLLCTVNWLSCEAMRL